MFLHPFYTIQYFLLLTLRVILEINIFLGLILIQSNSIWLLIIEFSQFTVYQNYQILGMEGNSTLKYPN